MRDQSTREVDCLHHTASCKDPQHRVEIWIRWDNSFVERFRKCLATADVHLEALRSIQMEELHK